MLRIDRMYWVERNRLSLETVFITVFYKKGDRMLYSWVQVKNFLMQLAKKKVDIMTRDLIDINIDKFIL